MTGVVAGTIFPAGMELRANMYADGARGYAIKVHEVWWGESRTGIVVSAERKDRRSKWVETVTFRDQGFPTLAAAIDAYFEHIAKQAKAKMEAADGEPPQTQT